MPTNEFPSRLIDADPVPEGVEPFQQTDLDGVAVELFQLGDVIVTLCEDDSLFSLEIAGVVLDGQVLPANLLGTGSTEEGRAFCSIYVQHTLYSGCSPRDLDFIWATCMEPDAE